ncbi:MAG: HDOD domain-containing protein [Anaeromyxobacteraceae bacterium]
MNAELERRLVSCPTLPTLPAVALEVLRLCHAEDVDLWRIAEALSQDPALAGRVLRAANSASLAARGKVSTVTRAVPLLGSNTTLAIALSFSLVRNRRRGDASGFDHGTFWRRAVFSALAGRTLAEAGAPALDPEEVFLAALLQDIGMLALVELFDAAYGAMCAASAGDHARLAEFERAAWGADHAEVSGFLARSWHLPPLLEHAAQASHGGGAAAPGADARRRRFLACVELSGRLADVWVAPGDAETVRPALEAARAALGVAGEALEALVSRMALAVPEAAADFDLDLGGQEHIDAVLAEARRLPSALGLGGGPAEAGPRVESGEALDGALRWACEFASARRETIALLSATAATPGAFAAEALLALVRRSLRGTDLVGLDPQGVVALLPGAELAGARVVAERVLARAAALEPPLRVAIGIALAGPDAPGSAASLRAAAAAAAAVAGPGRAVVAPGGGAA